MADGSDSLFDVDGGRRLVAFVHLALLGLREVESGRWTANTAQCTVAIPSSGSSPSLHAAAAA